VTARLASGMGRMNRAAVYTKSRNASAIVVVLTQAKGRAEVLLTG